MLQNSMSAYSDSYILPTKRARKQEFLLLSYNNSLHFLHEKELMLV